MSNASHLTANLQSRSDALWAKFDRFGDILNLILREANAVTLARDLGQEADTRELARLLGSVEDFVSTVRDDFVGALVLAEEAWGGMDNAPEGYFSAYLCMRSLKSEVEVLRKDARSLCHGVSL